MSASSHRGFPPIADYGFLSDCHTGALVAPDGTIEWLCLPRFDSASVLGAILDRDAGSFRLAPRARVPVARRYEPGTNLLETTWATDRGWLVVRDGLAIGRWRDQAGDPHARPPSDHDAEHVLVRTAECIEGEVEVDLALDLVFDYGRRRPQWQLAKDHSNAEADLDGLRVRLTTDLRLGAEGSRLIGRHRLGEGDGCFCALSWSDDLAGPSDLAAARSRLERTGEFWRRWLGHGNFPDHPWRVHLQRSALTLKGLIYAPTGATVAAATTSLPETPGGERNWDYRYTWIRDATFMLWGLHVLGFDWEAQNFIEFVADVCRDPDSRLQIMYGIGGERDLAERTLDHLSGYEGARPVRIGNAAHTQRQNDVYGALLDAIYIHSKARNHVAAHLWELVRKQVDTAAEVWIEPDQGIWEARGEPRHYVSSKLMSWVALDRGARIARRQDEQELADRWHDAAGVIRADLLEHGVSDRGVFRQRYDSDALDASTLLVPLVRFLPPQDQRVRATVLAIADELTEGGLVLRYRVEETDDGLPGREGAFTICSFWLVSALSEIGEADRARALCERLLGMGGSLGLYAEEVEAGSFRHLGNFPQGFTHLALINAVSHVIADETAARELGRPTAVFSEMRSRRFSTWS